MRNKQDGIRKISEKEIRRKLGDNSGSALLMVMVTVAFIGMLASVLMYVTLTNYKDRLSEQRAKDSFYSAEQALAEIEAGLSRHVNEAFSTAYIQVMQNYGSNDLSREVRFREIYKQIMSALLQDSANPGLYSLDMIRSFVTGQAPGPDTEGVIIDSDNPRFSTYADGFRLMDIRVTYTDSNGYISVIETDIVVQVPEIMLGDLANFPELLDFALIANTGLTVAPGKSTVEGGLYGGANGIQLLANADLTVSSYTNGDDSVVPAKVQVITDKLVTVGVNKNDPENEPGAVPGSAVFKTEENVSLWVEGIVVNGETSSDKVNVDLGGRTYILDDLTIRGKENQVKLSGEYYGYGSEINSAKNSSSILINGTKAGLDMSGLKTLLLAGSAYIGTSKVESQDANTPNQDIRLGSSVSSKAEQIAFLVPPECIGYDETLNKAKVGKNPVNTKDKSYVEFMKSVDIDPRAKEVNLDLIDKTLGKPLSNYGASYEKVYHKVNEDTVWVYYYLKFFSASSANEFFRDYFTKAPKKLTSYMKNYVSSFKINPELLAESDEVKMDIAGNMIMVTPATPATPDKEPEYKLIEATDSGTAEEQVNRSRKAMEYANQFEALCKKLISEYGSLTGEERENSLFDNIIVNMSKLNTEFTSRETVFTSTSSGDKAKLIQKGVGTNTPVKLSEIADSDVHLIITDLDVIVDKDFVGLIISGGKVTINKGVNLKVYDKIIQCFGAEAENSRGDKVTVLSLFKHGSDSTFSSVDLETLTPQGLITFENRRRK